MFRVQILSILPIVSTSATDARKRFFELLEMVTNDHHVVLVNRRGGENVALRAGCAIANKQLDTSEF